MRLLRNGPSVRGRTQPSRNSRLPAALKLLASSRGLATAHTPEIRSPAGPPGSNTFQFLSCRFESCLPLNLRSFLAAELGARLCLDDNAIAPGKGEFPEIFIRDLARAIRRFSFERAHESWIESVVGRAALEDGLRRAGQASLCLRCARVSFDVDTLAEHRDVQCLVVPIGRPGAGTESEKEALSAVQIRSNLYQEIESFRRQRAAQGLPHFDLDYYLRDSHYVFTWRPLPSP